MENKGNTKECEHSCPKCNAGMDDIEWGHMESDSPPYQNGTCTKCGCKFTELYKYDYTYWEE